MADKYQCNARTNSGYYLPLPNGYCVSIQFGGGNYGSNYNVDCGSRNLEADIVETAIFSPEGGFVKYKGDSVQAYQSKKQVLNTINYASKLPKQKEK